jgi:hypothetical protein
MVFLFALQRGKESIKKGSNWIDLNVHFGQSTIDLYCPYIKSTIMD